MTQVNLNGKEYLMVECPADIYRPHIQGNQFGDAWADEEFMPYETLPPGNYSLIGLCKDIGEDGWMGIVDYISDNGMNYRDYELAGYFNLETATESARSLVSSKKMDWERTVILGKL